MDDHRNIADRMLAAAHRPEAVARAAARAAQDRLGLGSLGNVDVVQPHLSRLIERVHRMSSEADGLRGGLATIGDRVFGGVPAAGAAANAQPVRSGAIGTLEDALDVLESLISSAMSEARRLEALA